MWERTRTALPLVALACVVGAFTLELVAWVLIKSSDATCVTAWRIPTLILLAAGCCVVAALVSGLLGVLAGKGRRLVAALALVLSVPAVALLGPIALLLACP
jgi:hypothetical protein